MTLTELGIEADKLYDAMLGDKQDRDDIEYGNYYQEFEMCLSKLATDNGFTEDQADKAMKDKWHEDWANEAADAGPYGRIS